MRHPRQAVSRRGRQRVRAVSLAVEAMAANAHHFSIRVSRSLAHLALARVSLTVY